MDATLNGLSLNVRDLNDLRPKFLTLNVMKTIQSALSNQHLVEGRQNDYVMIIRVSDVTKNHSPVMKNRNFGLI